MELLEHTAVIDVIGRKNVFLAQPGIGASLDQAKKAGYKWLAGQKQPAAAISE